MSNLNCLGVIPARYPSSRLPGKPLKDIAGKSLVQRVWEQACKARNVSEVVIATDDERIAACAEGFGAKVMMTGSHHNTGSDRVGEVMQRYAARGADFPYIANIQGDMPFINPEVIDRTIQALAEGGPAFGMSTVATPILSEEEYLRESAVKVVLANDHSALYFSRATVPFARDGTDNISPTESEPWSYKHMGLYVFRPQTLAQLAALPQSLLERREKLEQLRALCGGVRIKVALVPPALVSPGIEVDTEDDLQRARAACAGT